MPSIQCRLNWLVRKMHFRQVPIFPVIVLTILGAAFFSQSARPGQVPEGEGRSRQKRVVWMKNRRLILPPGSILTLSPTLQIPFLRQPPEGINSDIKVSWLFYMFFDKLGMTDEAHPWPPFYPFSDIFRVVRRRLYPNKRSVLSFPPPDKIQGGERAVLIPQLENILESVGISGRACLLRAVCEIHELSLEEEGYGLFGEILTLIFTVSRSRYAQSHMKDYLKAEKSGRAGSCLSYYQDCQKSLFGFDEKNKYAEKMQTVLHRTDGDDLENNVM